MESQDVQDSGAESRADEETPGAYDLAREAFTGLEKALKVRRLYDSGHKLRGEAIEDLDARFGRALDELEDLTIEVEPETLSFEGHPVLRDARREGAIPYKLFRDGIRSITFQRGLEGGEIRGLLEVLEARPDTPGHFDDDMATLLWRRDFRKIQYVAIDELGGGGVSAAEGGGALAEMTDRIQHLAGSITSLDVPEWTQQSGVRVAAERKDVFEMERRSISTETADDVGTLEVDPDALDRLHAEVETDDVGSLINRVVDILFDVFREKQCALELEDVRGLIGQFLLAGLEKGDLPALNEMLDRFLQQTTPGSPVEWLIDGLMDDLATEEAMTHLRDAVRAKYEGGPESLKKLLGRLPSAALSWAARHARELADGPEKDAYHEILGARGPENPEATIIYLHDGPPARILEALRAFLEGGGCEGTAEVVSDLLRHDDVRVRVEAVRSLDHLSTEQRTPLLAVGLADVSIRVRMAALRTVGQTSTQALLRTLIRRVDEEEQEEDERHRLFHVIGTLGGPVAVECLARHLGPRRMPWMMGKKAIATRRQGILALRGVEDPTVCTFIAEGTASRDKTFANACRAVRSLTRSDQEQGR